jgi:hypothetical protein
MKKKTLVVLLAISFLPVLPALAFEHGGGGDGYDRGGGEWQGRSASDSTSGNTYQGDGIKSHKGGGSTNKGQGQSNRKNYRSRSQSRVQGQGGYQKPQNNGTHHFGGTGSTNRANSQAVGGQYPQSGIVHHFGNTGSGSFSGNRVSSGGGFNGQRQFTLSPRAQGLGITRVPQVFNNRHQLMPVDQAHTRIPQPISGPQGASLHASLISRTSMNGPIVRSQMSVVGRPEITAQVGLYNRTEVVPNHYYWHNYNGWNYCHYYDPYGYHWYGWYVGGNCFWSRYWGGNWWWYDPTYYHWCYWNDGWWWWQDPANVQVVYVYDNGSYVNAASVGETASASAPSGSPSGAGMEVTSPSSSSESTASSTTTKPLPPVSVDKVLNSKDGTRQVKIVGGDAFLYDTVAADNDSKPVFLSDNVKDVKFIPGTAGAAPQVLVTLTDGTVQTYDSDGNLVQDKGQS